MNNRQAILQRIRSAQVPAEGLPDLSMFSASGAESPVEQFKNTLAAIGGQVIEVASMDVLETLLAEKSEGKRWVNTCSFIQSGERLPDNMNPTALCDVFLASMTGILAVAENGAVWVTEEQMKVRALPFICEHLALVVEKKKIVANMHAAYNLLDTTGDGFGAFIAGPSKTADIEQSLVLGAHGSRTLTVFLV
ncbi:MAG: LutC/YkgG family protein [Bacteroidota bacterium]